MTCNKNQISHARLTNVHRSRSKPQREREKMGGGNSSNTHTKRGVHFSLGRISAFCLVDICYSEKYVFCLAKLIQTLTAIANMSVDIKTDFFKNEMLRLYN